MQSTFKRLSETFETTPVSRRAMLGAIPALALASGGWAGTPQAGPPIPVEKLHSFGLAVRDVNRSMEFYQALFGMPIQARQGATVWLRSETGRNSFRCARWSPAKTPPSRTCVIRPRISTPKR